MKPLLPFTLFLIICLAIAQNSNAHDITICPDDSVQLSIDEEYRGDIQWQQSKDSLLWEDIEGATINNYWVYPDSSTYYRIRIKEPDCEAIYSQIIHIHRASNPTLTFEVLSDTSYIYYMDVLTFKTDPSLNYWFCFSDSIQTNYLQGDTLRFRSPFEINDIEVVAKNDEGCKSDTTIIHYQSLPIAKLNDDVFFFTEGVEQLNVDTTYEDKTLYFSKNIPSTVLKVEKIIFGGDPNTGFLLRIKSINENDSSYVISGTTATMFDLIPENSPFEEDIINIASLSSSIANARLGKKVHSFDLGMSSSNARLEERVHSFDLGGLELELPTDGSIIGKFGFSNIELNLTTHDPVIKSSTSGYHFEPGISNININVNRYADISLQEELVEHGHDKEIEEEFEWFEKEIPFSFLIGWFLVKGELEIEINGSYTINLDLGLTLEDKIAYNFSVKKAEVFINKETGKIEFLFDYDKSTDYDFGDFDINATSSLNFDIDPATPEIGIEFYGFIGPYIKFPWGLRTKAEVSTEEYWNLNARVEGHFELGGKLEIPDLPGGDDEDYTLKYEFPSLFDTVIYNAPDSIVYISGGEQAGEPGTTMSEPLVVKVLDFYDKAVPLAIVFFNADSTFGDKVNGKYVAKVITDHDGEASVSWTLGEMQGTRTVKAHVYTPEGKNIKGGPIVFGRNCTSLYEDLAENWWEELEEGMQKALNLSIYYETEDQAKINSTIKPTNEEIRILFCDAKKFTVGKYFQVSDPIGDLNFIEKLKKLETIYIESDAITGGLSLNGFKNLNYFEINGPINYINLSGTNLIENFRLQNSLVDSLDLSGNTHLSVLRLGEKYSDGHIYDNNKNLSYLDIENCRSLSEVNLKDGSLKTILLNGANQLEEIWLKNNELDSIDVTGLAHLKILLVAENNISTISGLNSCDSLNLLYANNNKIDAIDISTNKMLEHLWLYKNRISGSFVLDDYDSLLDINLTTNEITHLEIKNCKKLIFLWSGDNPVKEIYIDSCDNFEEFPYINTGLNVKDHNSLRNLKITNCKSINRIVLNYSIADSLSMVTISNCDSLKLISLKSINSPFKLEISELGNLDELNLNGCVNFESLVGLSGCPNLSKLNLQNTALRSLDLSGLLKLEEIKTRYMTRLEEFKYDKLDYITELDFKGCKLKSLELQDIPLLKKIIDLNHNQIINLKIENCPELISNIGWWFEDNGVPTLKNLQLINCPNVKSVGFFDQPISHVNLSGSNGLETISIKRSKLTSLILPEDLSNLNEIKLIESHLDLNTFKSIIDQLPCGISFEFATNFTCDHGVPEDNGIGNPGNPYFESDCYILRDYIDEWKAGCN